MLAMEQQIGLKNILYLTDFSDCSKAALPYAKAVAHAYGGKIFVLHSLVPDAMACLTPELTAATITLQEQDAAAKMREIAAQLEGEPYEMLLDEGQGIWRAVQSTVANSHIDVIILGTHARKGMQRLLLGSIAEEIFRRSDTPVLMVGPLVAESARRALFDDILVTSDFSPESHRAVEFAAQLAQENHAHLALLHVIKTSPKARVANAPGQSVANALGQLHDQFPSTLHLEARPDFFVQYGAPAEQIVLAAQKMRAGVIILGIRPTAGSVGFATHVDRPTAHKVVALAPCPVLMTRG